MQNPLASLSLQVFVLAADISFRWKWRDLWLQRSRPVGVSQQVHKIWHATWDVRFKKIRGEFLFYHSEMISASLWHTASISNVSIMSTHNSAWEQCCNVTSLSSWGHIINNQHIPTYILSYISTRAPQFPLHLLTIYSKPWSCQSSRGTSASPGGLTNALETLRGIWNKVRKSNLLNSTSPTPCALIPYGCYHQHPAMHGH